jgi:hypothetical protein
VRTLIFDKTKGYLVTLAVAIVGCALVLFLYASFAQPSPASAHEGYPYGKCPSDSPQRFKKDFIAKRALKHMSFYLLAEEGGLKAVRVGVNAQALVCGYHAYLTDAFTVDTSALRSDEALILQTSWQTNDGYWHTTHHSDNLFPYKEDVQRDLTPYNESTLYELRTTENFKKFRVNAFVVKSNDTGNAISTPNGFTCDLGSRRNPGKCSGYGGGLVGGA